MSLIKESAVHGQENAAGSKVTAGSGVPGKFQVA